MNEVGFTCATRELVDKVSKLRSLQKGVKRKKATIEIRVQPQYVSFHTLGGTVKLLCPTKGWGSYTLSLEYFYMILTDYSGDVFSPKFIDEGMEVGGLFTRGLGCAIEATHPENQPTFNLPINYTDVDILALPRKYTLPELKLTNAQLLVVEAEACLEERIRLAHKHLEPYGITIDELTRYVWRKIEDRT